MRCLALNFRPGACLAIDPIHSDRDGGHDHAPFPDAAWRQSSPSEARTYGRTTVRGRSHGAGGCHDARGSGTVGTHGARLARCLRAATSRAPHTSGERCRTTCGNAGEAHGGDGLRCLPSFRRPSNTAVTQSSTRRLRSAMLTLLVQRWPRPRIVCRDRGGLASVHVADQAGAAPRQKCRIPAACWPHAVP